jgi:hypothetical protein
VVRTWSKAQNKDVGIKPKFDLNKLEDDWPGYLTGDDVPTLCYNPKGRPAKDADTKETSTVWYQLNDERKRWLPGMFLEFDGRAGTTPPAGMPECRQ